MSQSMVTNLPSAKHNAVQWPRVARSNRYVLILDGADPTMDCFVVFLDTEGT